MEELGRPRIDVTIRISGFFRDAFPNLVHLLDQAVEQVALLDEPDEHNFVAAHYRSELVDRQASGEPSEVARERARYRLFGSKPGTYGAGILPLLDERNWQDDQDLARVYAAWGGYAYTRQSYGQEAIPEFKTRFGQIVVAALEIERDHEDRVLPGPRPRLLRGGCCQLGVVDVGCDTVDAVDFGTDRLGRRPLALGEDDRERLTLRVVEVVERLVDLLRARTRDEKPAARQVLGLAARERRRGDEHEHPRHEHEAAVTG